MSVLPTCTLGLSYYSGTFTATNNASANTYAIWIANGGFHRVVLTNSTTSQSLTWDGYIGVDDYLRFNLDPAKQTVVDSAGTDRSANLVAGSAYWPLVPGVNTIAYQVYQSSDESSLEIMASASF